MPARSAGILLFRRRADRLELFLAHPGGPYWTRKDDGAWMIPKGLVEEGEDPLAAAKREFREETGLEVSGEFLPLGEFRQAGGKLVTAFGLEGDADPKQLASNSFSMEWPPRSGKQASFPEIDRVGWFDLAAANAKILDSQRPIIKALLGRLGFPADA